MSLDALSQLAPAGLKEVFAKLPKDVKAYAESLLALASDQKPKGKGAKEEGKVKEEGKAKEEGKKGKKGRGRKEQEEVQEEEQPVVATFLDGLKQVTDFGGPLFKSYDRSQK